MLCHALINDRHRSNELYCTGCRLWQKHQKCLPMLVSISSAIYKYVAAPMLLGQERLWQHVCQARLFSTGSRTFQSIVSTCAFLNELHHD
eukprot:490-Pleurochrysis_carterae.AAC.2